MRNCYKCCHTNGRKRIKNDGDITIDGCLPGKEIQPFFIVYFIGCLLLTRKGDTAIFYSVLYRMLTIHRGRALEKVGAHCRNHNAHSVGVCYKGGVDANGKPKDTRTLEQKGALLALLRELKRQFPKALIVGHRDLNPMKECPCFGCVKEYSQV